MNTGFRTNRQEAVKNLGFYKNTSYDYFDGEEFITFDVIAVGEEKRVIFIAVTNRGKITVNNYDLLFDKNGELYFYYGLPEVKIYLSNFEEVALYE